MTQQEFDTQFQRLVNEWPRGFGSSKMDLLWGRVQHKDRSSMESAVDAILAESKYAPSVAEILHKVNSTRSKYGNREPECFKCLGSGMILTDTQGQVALPDARRCPACNGG